MDIIYFFYGLSFVVMGIALYAYAQPTKESGFKLARFLWLLSGFAVFHAANEFLDMWAIIKARPVLPALALFCLAASYFFLLEFGKKLVQTALPQSQLCQQRLRAIVSGWVFGAAAVLILIGSAWSHEFWETGRILARYFLGLPACLLACFAFLAYYRHEERLLRSFGVKTFFMLAGWGFLVYGILSCLFVPRGDFFPADWMNADAFLATVGIPVQLFRALCAIAITWGIIGMLRIFDWEMREKVNNDLVGGLPDCVLHVSLEGTLISMNQAGCALYGFDAPTEALGKDAAVYVVENRDGLEDAVRRAAKGDTAYVEYKSVGKNGKAALWNAMVSPVKGLDGGVMSVLVVARDVTERRVLEQQFLQAQKLEAAALLASGLTHDFNNILTVITGYSYLLIEELKNAEPLTGFAKEISRCVRSAAYMSRQMLAFSRKHVAYLQVLDLNAVALQTVKMLQRALGDDITLVTTLFASLWPVKADHTQMEQIILNLAFNARDAMPKGGRLTITTENIKVGPDGSHATGAKLAPGAYVCLSVSDTGAGMDAGVLKRVFEPFFTTKQPGRGTGLGLAAVHGIVERHGGQITVQSEPGKGSVFRVYLARAEGGIRAMLPGEAAPQARGGSETILVVEDHTDLRALVVKLLREKGYQVLQAAQAEEALAIGAQQGGKIDLLLTDIVLPDIRGTEVAEWFLARWPALKVVYMSGSFGVVTEQVAQTVGATLLEKPFAPTLLLERIRQVLDSSREAQTTV